MKKQWMKTLFYAASLLTLSTILVGCATNNNSGDFVNSDNISSNPYSVQGSLAQAAQSVSQSLQSLASIRKSQYPANDKLPYHNLKTGQALNQTVAMQWYGPIQPILSRISNKIGYSLQVYGKRPATPVLVDINTVAHPQTALVVIRNIDLQAGLNASIMLFPKQKVISLRYV